MYVDSMQVRHACECATRSDLLVAGKPAPCLGHLSHAPLGLWVPDGLEALGRVVLLASQLPDVEAVQPGARRLLLLPLLLPGCGGGGGRVQHQLQQRPGAHVAVVVHLQQCSQVAC
jgi:hypothetical protein